MSACLSRYLLLNHWAEFYQTCYITSPHGKGVREQHYFSVRLSVHLSVHLSVKLSPPYNHWVEFNQTCDITSSQGKGVWEQRFFSVRPSTLSCIHLFTTLSPKQLGGIQPNVLHHFPSLNGCARATLFFYASVRPCGRRLSICPSRYLIINHWVEFNLGPNNVYWVQDSVKLAIHHFPSW